MTDTVIELHALTKRYGDQVAVGGIDLTVARGEVVALLGPNGAGKTTTVEILEGYRSPTSGQVQVLGQNPVAADDRWRSRIGIVHQETQLPPELTSMELLRFQAGLYPTPIDPAEALDLVGLSPQADQRAGTLSGGQQRRLQVALGIVGDPEVVFLDEPTTGLDPEARRHAWDLVEGLTAADKTVLLTTHYLEEAERLADRLAVIVAGRVVAEGTPGSLGGRREAEATISFRYSADLPPLPAELAAGGTPPEVGELVLMSSDRPTATVAALAGWAAAAGRHELDELAVTRRSLEDTYLALVAEHGPSEPAEETR